MKPENKCKGIQFYPVPEFSELEVFFGADESRYFNRNDLPSLPSEFEDFAQRLFFYGGSMPKMNDSVNVNDAARAVRALLYSFEPSHESKIATVGYAFWVWTQDELMEG